MFILFVLIRYILKITNIIGKTEQHKYFYFDNNKKLYPLCQT